MSFSLAITAAGPRLNLDAFSAASIDPLLADAAHTPVPVPDPPMVSSLLGSRLDAVALNPQPLPPREGLNLSMLGSRLDAVALNPQPLPPREGLTLSMLGSHLDAVALNPQPLPPSPWPDRIGLTLSHHAITALVGGAHGKQL
jgi:hypothetical protein